MAAPPTLPGEGECVSCCSSLPSMEARMVQNFTASNLSQSPSPREAAGVSQATTHAHVSCVFLPLWTRASLLSSPTTTGSSFRAHFKHSSLALPHSVRCPSSWTSTALLLCPLYPLTGGSNLSQGVSYLFSLATDSTFTINNRLKKGKTFLLWDRVSESCFLSSTFLLPKRHREPL